MMNSLYVANENGDWWILSPDDVIYVMSANKILPEGISDADDKFEQVIMEHGTVVQNLYEDLASILDS
ncbi:MAG: hypothetical protein EBY75_06075 [Actinobacteria bacterium]|nr:hypothetical protein [Actinomycetota bacterium]